MSMLLTIVIVFGVIALIVYGVEYFTGGPIKPLRIGAAVVFAICCLSILTGHGFSFRL